MHDVRARCADLPPPLPGPALEPDTREAAVLLPLFEQQGETRLVLTRRPDTMPNHQGEIAFPGGKIDPHLDATPRDAALREAEEEIGLPRDSVDVIGELDTMHAVSGPFLIAPFVGLIGVPPTLVPDPREVERVFHVSLSTLLSDEVHSQERWDLVGAERTMHFFELEDETIWGVTARILAGFLAHLVGTPIFE
ncbi:MAG: CoA pyrophosphatase [Acidimicrobiia bacterium]